MAPEAGLLEVAAAAAWQLNGSRRSRTARKYSKPGCTVLLLEQNKAGNQPVALGVIGDPPQVLAPYLAMDVYDLLWATSNLFPGSNLHSEVIEQFYPEYAAIAYARKKRPEKRSTLATRLRLCRDLLQFRSDLGRQPACVSATFLLAQLAYYLAIGESSRLEDVMALPVYLMQLESLARTSAR